jgi:tRNA pseudouridine-54 N-methylase
MRHFVYFSSSAVTSGKALSQRDLMQAGRMDIAIHSFIQGVFLSHGIREDVIFHFIFYGMPDPPKHIEIKINEEIQISKKDVGTLLKKILYKYQKGEKKEVFPGCFIEKKSLLNLIEELSKENLIFLLDKKGEDIRKSEIPKNCVFILGDQDGFPRKELKRLKSICTPVSIGNKMYFASQTVAVVNNELDYREI